MIWIGIPKFESALIWVNITDRLRIVYYIELKITSIKFFLFLTLVFLASVGNAEERKLRTIRQYCSVVEVRIVNLSEAQIAANTELGKYAADKPTVDAKKFQEAKERLESFSVSLKENEEEWARLGCVHIYPK